MDEILKLLEQAKKEGWPVEMNVVGLMSGGEIFDRYIIVVDTPRDAFEKETKNA